MFRDRAPKEFISVNLLLEPPANYASDILPLQNDLDLLYK